MQKSVTIGALAKALVKFQGSVGKIKKEETNPFFNKKYASLANILDVIQVPLAESGLAVAQFPDGDELLTTILMHEETGEYIEASYNIHASKKDPQGIGSAITYARRYALGAVLGLNIDEDDDGAAAMGQQPAKSQNGQQKTPPKNDIREKVVEACNAVRKAKKPEDVAAFGQSLPVEIAKDSQFREACKHQLEEIKKNSQAA